MLFTIHMRLTLLDVPTVFWHHEVHGTTQGPFGPIPLPKRSIVSICEEDKSIKTYLECYIGKSVDVYFL